MQVNSYLYQRIREIDHDEMRPKFHFTAPVGWLNDPNGLIYYNGYYQLFYQYNPYAPHWDAMHWGHARSKDGIHWQDLPVALMPDQAYDKSGVFSGSAIENDGRLYAIYTGHVVDENGQATETQCVAWSDNGIDFHKYEGNPVMTIADIPGAKDKGNFRDPKVFEHNNKYYCIIATVLDGKGSLVLFESTDLLHWSFKSVLLHNDELGIMTECPDFISLSGQDYLLFSVIKGEGQNNIVYAAAGYMDWLNFNFKLKKMTRLDDGDDFYASQSFVDKDNNRIVIPWLRSVDHIDYLENHGHLWNGLMGIPRRLTVTDDHLLQQPIGSIKELPLQQVTILLGNYQLPNEIKVGEELLLKGKNGQICIARKEQNKYLIEIHSPAFIKTISWSTEDHHLVLVIDNSSLEIFSSDRTLSVVTFVDQINKAEKKEV